MANENLSTNFSRQVEGRKKEIGWCSFGSFLLRYRNRFRCLYLHQSNLISKQNRCVQIGRIHNWYVKNTLQIIIWFQWNPQARKETNERINYDIGGVLIYSCWSGLVLERKETNLGVVSCSRLDSDMQIFRRRCQLKFRISIWVVAR